MIKLKISIISIFLILTMHASAQHPAGFMYEGKWGVMHHFLADFYQAENPEKWNKLVDEFDVKALANQLASVHTGWVIFTIGQNSGYYCSPNSVYDKAMNYTQSHCSKRDLIADLADALNEKGIPLIAYIPFGFKDSHAPKNWWYADMVREYSMRWGNKIKGWWIDGYYGSVEYIPEMAEAFLSGNPTAALAFNPGLGIIDRTCEFENYTAGEFNDILHVDIEGRWKNGAQWHCVTKNTVRWGGATTTADQKIPLYSEKEIVDATLGVVAKGGAITWNVDLNEHGIVRPSFQHLLKTMDGSIKENKNVSTKFFTLQENEIANIFLQTNQNLIVGEKTKISIVVLKNDGTYINATGMMPLKLDNSVIGSVDKNGIFSAINVGEVMVVVKVGKKFAKVKIRVSTGRLESIELKLSNSVLSVNESAKITAVGLMSDHTSVNLNGTQITYTLNHPEKALIDSNGDIIAIQPGRILITAKAEFDKVTKTAILPLVIKDNEILQEDDNKVPPFIALQSDEYIAIDGNQTESIWKKVFEYPLSYNQRTSTNYTPPSEKNISASFMLAFKGDTLYGIIKRSDDITYTANCVVYINDGVEIYIGLDGLHQQLSANVGKNFTVGFNKGYSKISWNAAGTVGEFAIQIPGLYLPGQTIDFNIDVVDNDNTFKVFQLFPTNGYGKSFLGKNMPSLKFVDRE